MAVGLFIQDVFPIILVANVNTYLLTYLLTYLHTYLFVNILWGFSSKLPQKFGPVPLFLNLLINMVEGSGVVRVRLLGRQPDQ